MTKGSFELGETFQVGDHIFYWDHDGKDWGGVIESKRVGAGYSVVWDCDGSVSDVRWSSRDRLTSGKNGAGTNSIAGNSKNARVKKYFGLESTLREKKAHKDRANQFVKEEEEDVEENIGEKRARSKVNSKSRKKKKPSPSPPISPKTNKKPVREVYVPDENGIYQNQNLVALSSEDVPKIDQTNIIRISDEVWSTRWGEDWLGIVIKIGSARKSMNRFSVKWKSTREDCDAVTTERGLQLKLSDNMEAFKRYEMLSSTTKNRKEKASQAVRKDDVSVEVGLVSQNSKIIPKSFSRGGSHKFKVGVNVTYFDKSGQPFCGKVKSIVEDKNLTIIWMDGSVSDCHWLKRNYLYLDSEVKKSKIEGVTKAAKS